jgi:hypothetical protein
MGNGSVKDADELREEGDRLWILLDKGRRGPSPGTPAGARDRRTLIVRDGDKVLISVPVGRDTALATRFRIDQLPCAGARMVVRLAAEITPCAPCIEERLEQACEVNGGLGPQGILDAVRAGVARCAAQRRLDPAHGAETGSDPPPPSRSGAALRLAPPNAPHVSAGAAVAEAGDVDLILII